MHLPKQPLPPPWDPRIWGTPCPWPYLLCFVVEPSPESHTPTSACSGGTGGPGGPAGWGQPCARGRTRVRLGSPRSTRGGCGCSLAQPPAAGIDRGPGQRVSMGMQWLGRRGRPCPQPLQALPRLGGLPALCPMASNPRHPQGRAVGGQCHGGRGGGRDLLFIFFIKSVNTEK